MQFVWLTSARNGEPVLVNMTHVISVSSGNVETFDGNRWNQKKATFLSVTNGESIAVEETLLHIDGTYGARLK